MYKSYKVPNPVHRLFPSTMVLDFINVDPKTLEDLVWWARAQNFENVGHNPLYSTRLGDQFMPQKPIWEYEQAPGIKDLMAEVQRYADMWVQVQNDSQSYTAKPESSWFVFYDEGGMQWPHIHKDYNWTAIIGLRNNGTLLLEDARPYAVGTGQTIQMHYKEVIINPGQICITPGYIPHLSVPCYHKDGRDILVINGS